MATQASLDLEISTLLASNIPGGILATSLRQVLSDMNAAIFQSAPPTTPATANSILNASSASVSVWTPTPTLGTNGGTGGSLTLNGSTSGNASIAVDAASDTLNFLQSTFGNLFSAQGPNATIANYISFIAKQSGNAPSIATIGSDTNVDLNLDPQGTGKVNVIGTPLGNAILTVGGSGIGNGTIYLGSNTTGGTVSLSSGSAGGVLAINGYLATNTGGFQTVNGTAAVVTSGLVLVVSGSACVLTLPAATFIGQQINIKMGASIQTITSASSNVVPFNSQTAGTALLSGGGLTKFVRIVWDGVHWQMVEGA